MAGDAARLPFADAAVDGIISVEAAFHFRSRAAFFAECYRVLRPGGVLSISDISVEQWPVTPAELVAGLTQLRVFGLRPHMAMTARQIGATARAAGLADIAVTSCGDRVLAPALRLIAARPARPPATRPPPACCSARWTSSGAARSSTTSYFAPSGRLSRVFRAAATVRYG